MKNIHILSIALALFCGGLLAGCESETAPTTQASNTMHADCIVCKMNFDLACIDVAVDPKTPKYMYNGKTYYFCSDECHDKFVKAPEKYVGK